MSAAMSMLEGWMYDVKLRAAEEGFERTLAGLSNDLFEVGQSRAAIIADRAAVNEALKRVAPNHPLLVDGNLRESVMDAGIDCFKRHSRSSDYEDRVRQAHKTVHYKDDTPSVESLQQKIAELQTKLQETEDANVQNYAEKHVLREALALVDPKHPLLPSATGNQSEFIARLHKRALTIWSHERDYRRIAMEGRIAGTGVKDLNPNYGGAGERESVLEAYPGELKALRARVAMLESEDRQAEYVRQQLEAQAKRSPT